MRANSKEIKTELNKNQNTKYDKFIHASYGRRLMSNVIDGAILNILSLSILIAESYFAHYVFLNKIKPYDEGLIIFLVITLYYGFFESSKLQATPGKKLCGIKVVNTNGFSLSIWMAIARLLIAMSFYAVALMVLTIPLIYLMHYAAKIGIELAIFEVFGLPILLITELGLMYLFLKLINKNRTFYDTITKSHVLLTLDNKDH